MSERGIEQKKEEKKIKIKRRERTTENIKQTVGEGEEEFK